MFVFKRLTPLRTPMESTWYLGGRLVIQHVDHLHNLVVSVTTLLFEGGVQQGSLNYPF